MSIERARSIDDLHSRVAGADIVLSAEAPLTLALDRRVTQPRIGRLAATPRSHASGELVPKDVRPLFLRLVNDTELPWKRLARALELCLDCWNRTGSLKTILESPEFDTPTTRRVVDVLSEAPSSYHKLANERFAPDTDVRVVDPAGLTELDRQLLPADDSYEAISPFDDGTWSPPKFHLYPSATAIVDDLVDAIDADAAEQVAVVLDQSTSYSPLIEAALDAADIPYQGGPAFIDDDTVRRFVRLVRAAFAGSSTTLGELRPVLISAGISVPRQDGNRRLDHLDAPWVDRFDEFRTTVQTGTFEEVLDAYTAFTGTAPRHLSTLREELDKLGLLSAAVTAPRVDQLAYYLQSFEVPVDRESDGVLLTDAGSTAYVDRPVVFYLGLGDGWARTPPDYPWVESQHFIEQDMRRFKLLVQNGQQQHFLVQDTMAGEHVAPCVYLAELFDAEFEQFSDLPHVEHRGVSRDGLDPFDAPTAPDHAPIEAISQSTLKRLVNCPRDQYFHRLVDGVESLPMARGTVLHEAAELYVNHPAFVTAQRERVLTAMCDQLQPYLTDTRREVYRTRLGVGLDVIIAYLDQHPPEDATYDTYGPPKGDNELADRLDKAVDSPLCERWFESAAVGGRGFVDLLQDRTTLVDFKSGRKRSAAKVQSKASLDPIDSDPDFQVLLYLAHHRRECPESELRFRFVHLLDSVDEVVKGANIPLDDLVTTVTYVPASFSEFVTRRPVFDQLTDYADSNNRCKVLNTLGYDQYRTFFETHELPREGAAPDRRAEVKAAFERLATEEVGDYKYVSRGCETIFDDLADVPEGYYLRGDINAFETFLAERITELNEYRRDRFPVTFDDEPNWDRVDNRELILTDR